MTSVLERIQKRIGKQLKAQGSYLNIVELDLSEIAIKRLSPDMKREIEKCKNLSSLIMCECLLENLQNLPDLEELASLDLTTNKINNSHLIYLRKYKKLNSLYLIENLIDSVTPFKALKELPELNCISLNDNPVCGTKSYRQEMFKAVDIQVLDDKDEDGYTVYEDSNELDVQDIEVGIPTGEHKYSKKQNYSARGEQEGDESEETGPQSKKNRYEDEDDEDEMSSFVDDSDEYDSDGNVKYEGTDSEGMEDYEQSQSRQTQNSGRSGLSSKTKPSKTKPSKTKPSKKRKFNEEESESAYGEETPISKGSKKSSSTKPSKKEQKQKKKQTKNTKQKQTKGKKTSKSPAKISAGK